MKKILTPILLLLIGQSSLIYSQVHDRASIHQIQNSNPPDILQSPVMKRIEKSSGGILSRKVFGYHPYWINASAINSYQFDLLSRVIYFSYEVEPTTGKYISIHDWLTTPLVDKAHTADVKVQLCATNFGSANNTTLLSNPDARDTLIANLIRLVQMRNADGINIDFESVPASQRSNLVTFFRNLKTRMGAVLPQAEISVAAPAVDWSGSWDITALAQYIDYFFVMCYDYYWSGSDYAGPVAPLTGSNYNVTKSIDWYISQGVLPIKIIMGVPYYGYDWPVESDVMQSKTTGSGTAKTYSIVKQSVQQYVRRWNDVFNNPWYSYQNGSSWRQCWFDDSLSLSIKYQLPLQKQFAGIGIWALGYDAGNTELWDLIRKMFWYPTSVSDDVQPDEFILGQNYPNPFSSTTTIRFTVGTQSDGSFGHAVSLRVFDLLGREVLDLSDQIIGNSRLTIHNYQLPKPGMYFYRLISPNNTITKSMIYIQ